MLLKVVPSLYHGTKIRQRLRAWRRTQAPDNLLFFLDGFLVRSSSKMPYLRVAWRARNIGIMLQHWIRKAWEFVFAPVYLYQRRFGTSSVCRQVLFLTERINISQKSCGQTQCRLDQRKKHGVTNREQKRLPVLGDSTANFPANVQRISANMQQHKLDFCKCCIASTTMSKIRKIPLILLFFASGYMNIFRSELPFSET